MRTFFLISIISFSILAAPPSFKDEGKSCGGDASASQCGPTTYCLVPGSRSFRSTGRCVRKFELLAPDQKPCPSEGCGESQECRPFAPRGGKVCVSKDNLAKEGETCSAQRVGNDCLAGLDCQTKGQFLGTCIKKA